MLQEVNFVDDDRRAVVLPFSAGSSKPLEYLGKDVSGVYQVTVRYGWAEIPKDSKEVCSVLLALGEKACDATSPIPRDLNALAHLNCTAGKCLCTVRGADDCLPINFIVSRDKVRINIIIY